MKRILIALAVLLTVQVADAQMVKTPAAAKKALETAQAASENPKKEVKFATWLKLASAYMDAYNAPTGSFFLNAPRIQLQQTPGYKPAASVEEVVIEGVPYKKESYEDKVLYFDPSDMLTMIVVTNPVCEDPLAGALAAYAKAAELDVKGAKTKDILAGIELIGAKYFDEGMVQYTLGDYAAAADLIAKVPPFCVLEGIIARPVPRVNPRHGDKGEGAAPRRNKRRAGPVRRSRTPHGRASAAASRDPCLHARGFPLKCVRP